MYTQTVTQAKLWPTVQQCKTMMKDHRQARKRQNEMPMHYHKNDPFTPFRYKPRYFMPTHPKLIID